MTKFWVGMNTLYREAERGKKQNTIGSRGSFHLQKKKKRIIGYGATAKSCTVLNYCKFGPEEIDFFYDTTSYKIGKFLLVAVGFAVNLVLL